MQLLKDTLEKELSKILNPQYPGYSGMPGNLLDAAKNWASAFEKYTQGNTFKSSSMDPAKTAFIAQFLLMNNIEKNGLIQLTLAFTQYSIIYSTGITTGKGIPPASILNLSPALLVIPSGGNEFMLCSVMANLIDTWFKTGTVNIGGTIKNWN